MAKAFTLKPTHKAVETYYAALETYADQSVEHEGALRSAFQNLLADTGRKVGWTLIPELSLDANGHSIRPDGTFRNEFTIERGSRSAVQEATNPLGQPVGLLGGGLAFPNS